jgi:hypothetical protein
MDALVPITLILVFASIAIVSSARIIARRDIIHVHAHRDLRGFVFLAWMRLFIAVIIILLWFVLFASALSITIGFAHALTLSAGIVAAIRVTSYVQEGVAFELARVVPLAVLGAVLVIHPTAFVWAPADLLTAGLFLVVLEWIARIGSMVIDYFESPHL